MMRVAVVAVLSLVMLPGVSRAADLTPLEAQGEVVYQRYCVGCHGAQGDGRGPAAPMLLTQPRDFTSGIFKFRTTPSGALPTDEDLFRIITRGVYRTSMPEWSLLSERERWALVAYVKRFYPEWREREAAASIALPPAPAWLGDAEAIARGKELYGLLECSACHGQGGRGDGASTAALPPDAWGHAQRPFDFTKGRLKSGAAPGDVYRTFMTGLNGTAMPSYYDIFAAPDGENIRDDDAWRLVAYILSLRTPEPAAKGAPK